MSVKLIRINGKANSPEELRKIIEGIVKAVYPCYDDEGEKAEVRGEEKVEAAKKEEKPRVVCTVHTDKKSGKHYAFSLAGHAPTEEICTALSTLVAVTERALGQSEFETDYSIQSRAKDNYWSACVLWNPQTRTGKAALAMLDTIICTLLGAIDTINQVRPDSILLEEYKS